MTDDQSSASSEHATPAALGTAEAKQRIVYAHRQSIRIVSFWSLIGISSFWLLFYGFSTFFFGPDGGFVLFPAMIVCATAAGACLLGLIFGGTNYIEVNEEEILWRGTRLPEERVRYADVRCFNIEHLDGGGQRFILILKTGESILVPSMGEDWHLRNALATKIRFGQTIQVP